MCGISGFINNGNHSIGSATLVAMNHRIKHRGPDDEGYIVVNHGSIHNCFGPDTAHSIHELQDVQAFDRVHLGMGFRRLAILDLSSSGHQPMVSFDQRLALTFNGEIYNYVTLRNDLTTLGYQFKSNTDSEVILLGYHAWGNSLFKKLDGMFAIAIYDKAINAMTFARDRMGIKPLYFHKNADSLVWCSEIKGILCYPTIQKSINWEGVAANFYLQSTPAPLTCFEGIEPFPAAHYAVYTCDTKAWHLHKYWQIPSPDENQKISFQEASVQVEQLLQQSVTSQLIADVPIITLLSGGIDSTLITAMAQREMPDIQAYTLGIDHTGLGVDEVPQAKAMAKMLGIRHKVHTINPDDVIADLDQALRHYEDPYNDLEVYNTACQFLHNEGYKVIINGNGADELFGGYPYILRYPKWKKIQSLSIFSHLIPNVHSIAEKIKNKLQEKNTLDFYAGNKASMRRYQINSLWHANPLTSALDQIPNHHLDKSLHSLFEIDMNISVSNHHVMRDDLSAMRHSVELRYPYLQNELIDYVAKLPLHLRYNFQTSKPLLRQVAKSYIHEENLKMPKKGFSLPMGAWMQDNPTFKQYMIDQLSLLKKRGIFNTKTIDSWIQTSGRPFDFHKLWQLMTFEIWMQTYID